MAQSRVQQGKSKKSKFPMWVIGIIVVLVVVIAGYAIVRFSKAGGSGGTTYVYPSSNYSGTNGAYKTKISKTNGGTVDAWALPNGASLFSGLVGRINSPYGGYLNSCMVAQRLNGAIGQADIKTVIGGLGSNVSVKYGSATLNIGLAKNYCSGDINNYIKLPLSNDYPVAEFYIVNKSSSILYVTQMSYSY